MCIYLIPTYAQLLTLIFVGKNYEIPTYLVASIIVNVIYNYVIIKNTFGNPSLRNRNNFS